jgi:hypothetical protein
VRDDLLAFVGAMDPGGGDPQVAALLQRIKQADLAANVLVGTCTRGCTYLHPA